MLLFREFVEQVSLGQVDGNTLRVHDSKGIPRSEMPQIPKSAISNFVEYLKNHNIGIIEDHQYPIGLVRLTQADINLSKVRDMISKIEDGASLGSDVPFLMTYEGYLLDAQHRFLSLVYGGETTHVDAILIATSIETLIKIAHQFLEAEVPDE